MKPITPTRVKRKLIRAFFHEQWSLLVCDPDGKILSRIAPPKDRFWADPFPVEHNGGLLVFCEQQIGSGDGTLGVIEINPDMSRSDFIPILEKNYHLSFPNVFRHNDVWYMIPETGASGRVELYTAVEFPYRWEYAMTLMDNTASADPVVFYYNEKWWLFLSIAREGQSIHADLSLFYADSFPASDWTPHPRNPVCSGSRNSRMAGAIFINKESGLPNRPAQDCEKDYGQKIHVNEITELTPSSYKERVIKTILPEKELHAVCTHTLNHSEHFLLRDIKTRTPRPILDIFKRCLSGL
jgi:hypothetical protein